MATSSFSKSSTSVMVVDDDAFSREIVCEMLLSQGVTHVYSASNGRNALQQMGDQARPPDYLISDVFMPDMDGIELMNAMAKQHYAGGVILCSGINIEMLSLAGEIATAQGIHLLGAFVKPLHHDALARLIKP